MKKKQVEERVGSFPLRDLHGSLDDAIEKLQKLQKDHPNHSNLQFQLDGDYEYGIWGTRFETEQERTKRTKLAKEIKQEHLAEKKAQETVERAEYERLKNKFGVEYY